MPITFRHIDVRSSVGLHEDDEILTRPLEHGDILQTDQRKYLVYCPPGARKRPPPFPHGATLGFWIGVEGANYVLGYEEDFQDAGWMWSIKDTGVQRVTEKVLLLWDEVAGAFEPEYVDGHPEWGEISL